MKKAREVEKYMVRDCGQMYLVKNYRYRNHEYSVFINLAGGTDTKSQHDFAQQEIDSLCG